MTKPIRIILFLGAMLALFGPAPSAHAQASRTWISGLGDDVNPCSRTAPCKTFAGAISKTLSGGEIDVLDPGGFGAITITKPITFDGGGGLVASILVSGTNGVVVSAGSGNVILRNLRINGIGSGIDGVLFNSGTSLLIENCEIFGFTNNGVHVHTSTGTNNVVIENSRLTNNLGGVQVNPTGGKSAVSVLRTTASGNAFGFSADSTGGGAVSMIIDHSTANENTTNGVQASGGAATVLVSNSDFSHNSVGVTINSPATVSSFQNNVIAQNLVNNVVGTLAPNTLQ